MMIYFQTLLDPIFKDDVKPRRNFIGVLLEAEDWFDMTRTNREGHFMPVAI